MEKDPPLAAKLIKLVNSSFYGLLNKISNIDHAIVILGVKEVKNIALGFSVQRYFSQNHESFEPKTFWKHSIVTSQIAQYLGKKFNTPDDGSFFLTGLIHDIGKLVIAEYFRDEFSNIINYVTERKVSFSRAEKEILGVTHYQVAAKLLQNWHFPKKVTMQVFYHHAPWHDKNFSAGSNIIYLANIFAKTTGFASSEQEKTFQNEDLLIKPSVIDYLNKSGIDFDRDTVNLLKTNIQEFLAAETDNVLKIFE